MIGARIHRPGFTLIELLIVAAVFSLTALLASTVFTNIQSTQRAISGQQRTSADGRYILETIAQSIRTGLINYAVSSTLELTSPATTLSTVDSLGKTTCYEWHDQKVKVWTGIGACPGAGDVGWIAFTPDDLRVTKLLFYITPTSDPNRPVPRQTTDCKIHPPVTQAGPVVVAGYDTVIGACLCRAGLGNDDCYSGMTCVSSASTSTCTNPNVQPQVTMYLETESSSSGPGEQAKVTMQTTVVSRVYQR